MSEGDEEAAKLATRIRQLESENRLLQDRLDEADLQHATRARRRKSWAFFGSRVGSRAVVGGHLYDRGRALWDAFAAWFRSGRSTPWPEDATRDFAASLLARLTRVGLIAVMLAVLPLTLAICQTTILSKQNDIVGKQNELITTQNRFVEQQANLMDDQNHLAEASRRAGLIFELANISNEIREEVNAIETARLKAASGSATSTTRPVWLAPNTTSTVLGQSLPEPFALSSRLTNRIVSLSRALRPYRYYEYDDAGKGILRAAPSSPERGQLLITLIESRVDVAKFASRADFRYADLVRADLINQDLTGIDLERANLRGANLNGTNLSNADLRYADLTEASLNRVKLCGAYLRGSVFLNVAAFESADFSGAQVDDEQWLTSVPVGLANEWKVGTFGPTDSRQILLLKNEIAPRQRKDGEAPRPCGVWTR